MLTKCALCTKIHVYRVASCKRVLKKMHVWVLMMESKVGKRGGRRERDEAQSKGCSVGDIIEAYIRQ